MDTRNEFGTVHDAIFLSDTKKILIHCGRDLGNYRWDKPVIDVSDLTTRARHVALYFGGCIYVIGGADEGDDTFTDVWALSVSTERSTWKKIPCIGDIPPSISNASLSYVAESFVLFGGTLRGSGSSTNVVYRFFPSSNQWELVRFRGVLPRARNSHTAVVCTGNLYIFGGWDAGEFYDDMYALHSHCTAWSQIVPISSTKPCGRMGHSSSVYRHSMFVFGGFNHPDTLQDLWEYNFALSRWEEHISAGSPPQDRYRHSSVVLDDRLVIFGGLNAQRERFNDVHIYELNQRCWFKLEFSTDVPSPRSLHQAVCVADVMYILGGVGESEKLGDVWRLSSRQTLAAPPDNEAGWTLLSPAGLVPRTGHVACMSSQHIYVFGGQGEDGSLVSGMQVFDLSQRVWTSIESDVARKAPCHRSGAKAVAWDDAFVVFGGSSTEKRGSGFLNDMHVFWISRGEWQCLDGEGFAPPGRTDHALAFVNGDVVVYGGTNRKSIFGDTFRFASDASGWTEICDGVSPAGRFGHSAISWENRMVVFGGWDGSKLLNEIWQFELPANRWKQVRVAGKACSPRYRHSACGREGTMYVFGGVDSDQNRLNDLWAYNLNLNQWTEILLPGNSLGPCPRTFHQTVADGEFLYVLGGRGEDRKLGDVWRIRFSEIEESEPEQPNNDLHVELDRLKVRVAQLEARITCKVCMEADINCVLIPCTHRCVCLACAAVIVNRECVCPICRETILRLVETIDA